MMLSFGVFCFDLVVNKNCSLVIMEKTSRYQDKTEILLRLFHFFSGVIRPFLDCLHRKKSFMF